MSVSSSTLVWFRTCPVRCDGEMVRPWWTLTWPVSVQGWVSLRLETGDRPGPPSGDRFEAFIAPDIRDVYCANLGQSFAPLVVLPGASQFCHWQSAVQCREHVSVTTHCFLRQHTSLIASQLCPMDVRGISRVPVLWVPPATAFSFSHPIIEKRRLYYWNIILIEAICSKKNAIVTSPVQGNIFLDLQQLTRIRDETLFPANYRKVAWQEN